MFHSIVDLPNGALTVPRLVQSTQITGIPGSSPKDMVSISVRNMQPIASSISATRFMASIKHVPPPRLISNFETSSAVITSASLQTSVSVAMSVMWVAIFFSKRLIASAFISLETASDIEPEQSTQTTNRNTLFNSCPGRTISEPIQFLRRKQLFDNDSTRTGEITGFFCLISRPLDYSPPLFLCLFHLFGRWFTHRAGCRFIFRFI